MKHTSVLLAAIFATVTAHAADLYIPPRPQTQNTGNGTMTGGTTGGSTTGGSTTGGTAAHHETGTGNRPVTGTIQPVTGGSSINPGASQGQQSQNGGSGTNAAVGAALMAAGAAMMANPPTVPPGVMLMAMGMLAMMQSGHDSDAAGQSGNTYAASQIGSGYNGANGANTGPGTNPDTNGLSDFAKQKIKEGQAALEAQGYKMSEAGLKHPDGTFTPAKAFNSAESMKAAGIDPSAISGAQKILAQAANGQGLDNGARVSGVGVAGGGGGSGGAGGITEGDGGAGGDSSGYGSGNGNPFALNSDQRKQLVAGKTVTFGGEPIGVRGQNIFDMVHACYQKKRQGQHFIESEADVAVRAPASNPKKK